MTIRRRLVTTAACAASVIAPVGAAHAATRAPIKDCGDVATLDDDGAFIGAVTAQGAACTSARAIASIVAKSSGCKRQGSCVRRSYTCLLAKVGKELTLVRCENGRQTAFARFEFGS